MATLNRETIETFMSITGAPETIALRTLQEYAGNLNEAVNAHFSEGDRNVMQEAPATLTAPSNDHMDIDDPVELQPYGPSSLLSATRGSGMNPFSLLDNTFRSSLLDNTDVPIVSQPREVREIPVEVKDSHVSSASGPRVEDVTDVVDVEGPEIRGTVIIDDEDDDGVPGRIQSNQGVSWRRVSQFDDVVDSGNDIEEEMIRAAIEASKRDAELQIGDTTEQEIMQRELDLNARIFGSSTERPVDVEELANVTGSSQRQGVGVPDNSSNQHRREAGGSSTEDEVDVLDELPLVRRRSRRIASSSVNTSEEGEQEVSPVLSPSGPTADNQTQVDGTDFASAEWGVISSVEHDEAVMLEAAMFGGIPESGYQIPYAPHQMMHPHPGVDTPWTAPRPPSPSLVAQRAIREQQDDEYFASLQADREKEIAAREAALEEQKIKDEEAQRKLQEEQELERQLAAKQASLPEEPTLDDENAINLLVRMPDGSRHGRRFLKTDKLQSLFDFIDVGRMFKPNTYRLVRPFPRKVFSDVESSLSLIELGLTGKQEALFLELI